MPKPMIHVAVPADIKDAVLHDIEHAVQKAFGDEYDLVVTSDNVQLYVQDPEALKRIEEALSLLQEEVRAIRDMISRPAWVL